MLSAIGIIAFVVLLLFSVMFHEYGHFSMARRFGMKATDFFVGFGPTLWSFRKGETEYGIKAIPAGGFVKIVGMTDLEEIAPEDEPRAFYKQPPGKRAIVLAAGSVMHFILAFIIILGVAMFIGAAQQSSTIAAVSACVPVSETGACTASDPASPAKSAGLQAGDKVVSVNGQAISDGEDLVNVIRAQKSGPSTFVIERDGQQQTVTVDLVARTRTDINDATKQEVVSVAGFQSAVEMTRGTPAHWIGSTFSNFWQITSGSLTALVSVPSKVPELVRQTFSDQPRSDTGLIGVVGAARISGDAASAPEPAGARIGELLFIVAGLNIFIGIFNLLPLLPLDGGHLAILGYEQLRSRIARWRHKPDPGRVDIRKVMPAAYLFLAVLIGLSVLLLAADILNPVQLPS